ADRDVRVVDADVAVGSRDVARVEEDRRAELPRDRDADLRRRLPEGEAAGRYELVDLLGRARAVRVGADEHVRPDREGVAAAIRVRTSAHEAAPLQELHVLADPELGLPAAQRRGRRVAELASVAAREDGARGGAQRQRDLSRDRDVRAWLEPELR